MSNDKVIQFKPQRSFTHKTLPSDKRYCPHYSVLVDEEERKIECSECGIVLDPFDYLKDICYRDESAFKKYTQLQTELLKLEKRYKNLTSEIERLNRVKNALKNKS